LKKLTQRRKNWLLRRQRRQFSKQKKRIALVHNIGNTKLHRTVVRVWTTEGVEKVIVRQGRSIPPTRLCYLTNSEKTFEFLDRWRRRFARVDTGNTKGLDWLQPSRNPRGLRSMDQYIDFSQIEYVSTAAALVMTAEYDRLRHLLDSVPPAVELDRWHTGVFTKMNEIGFFENIGLLDELEDKFNTNGDIKTLKITSGRNAAELEEVSQKISLLCDFLDVKGEVMRGKVLDLNTALGEAMINVARHAYPDYHKFARKHVSKWWVTASVDRIERVLKVAIYDQGASIPVTYPRKRTLVALKEAVSKPLAGVSRFEFDSDGTYIHEAMQPAATQTNEPHRGKGLPEMREIVDALGDASMIIYSRGGICEYDGNKFTTSSQEYSVGGTLIEWTLRFNAEDQNDKLETSH